MQAQIAAAIEAGLTQNALSLRFSAITGQNPRSERASIRRHCLGFNLPPILFPADIVAQKRRAFVQIDNEHVYIAVIVEISERASTAAMRLRDTWTGGLYQLLEGAIAQIAKTSPEGSCSRTEESLVQLPGKRYL
jgi:hypothetical protein